MLQMTPRSCVGVDGPEMQDGPEMYELLSDSGVVCVNGLVKGDGVSVLMWYMCCLLHLYL